MARRGVNREPSANDPWFRRHHHICGGVYQYCGNLALGDPLPEQEPEPEPVEQPPIEAPMEGPAEPRPCRVMLRRLEDEPTLPLVEEEAEEDFLTPCRSRRQ